MATIRSAYVNALLADAAYVDDLTPGMTGVALSELLAPRMTSDLGTYIGENFAVVTQVGDLSSSFDATVWVDKKTGEVYVSMRGTQGLIDVQQDGDLALSGLAHAQLRDMVNWWLRATTSGMAPQVQLRSVVLPDDFPIAPLDFVAAPEQLGTGELPELVAIKSVNGHSLGGYLATAFARIFGGVWPIESVNTFNSAGFSRPASGNIEDGFDQISQIIGRGYGLSGFTTPQNNYFASNGINVTTNTWSPVGFAQYGERIGIFQEDGVEVTDLGITNHFMYKLSDVLALGDALAIWDPNLDISKLSTLVSAASSQMPASYEKLLDGFRRLLLGSSVVSTPIGDASGGSEGPQPESRAQYQKNIAELRAAIAIAPQSVSISDLTTMSPAELAGRAQAANGLAYRYALKELNPFAVLGPDSLYDGSGTTPAHNANGELDRYDVTKDSGVSDKWLEDRAKFFAALIKYNNEDRTDRVTPGDTAYRDGERQLTLRPFAPTKGMAFAKAGQQLSARDLAPEADLFGTNGADTILGSAGKSYVEAGGGDDSVTTFDGNDHVYAGAGSDTVAGGGGADVIVGGKDGDTELRGGDGNDIIWGDEDQTDARYAGANYGGIDNLYGEEGNDFLYGGGGNDRLEGGKGVDQLFGDGMDVDDPDRRGADILVGGDDGDFAYGGEGVDTIYGDDESINGTTAGGADNLQGGKGDDFLYGGGGADTILGGDDNDLIVGGHGSDTQLRGGAGDDTIYGGFKDKEDTQDKSGDRLFGEAGEDELYGGNGKDFLYGGDDNDKLDGGAENDRLEGGLGKDTYYYRPDEGRDIVWDLGNEGEILWGADEVKLTGGENRNGAGDFTYYDNPDDWRFIYQTSGDPDAGLVTLLITSRQGGLLEVQDWQNHTLDIHLGNGNPNNPNPPFLPNGGASAALPPAPPTGGIFPPRRGDPLVLDLDGLGITTLGLNAQLHFDHDGNGFAERTGWVGAGDGVLVLDANADGALTNGQELFGDFTRLAGGQLALNGFQALSAWDQNRDGRIDALDPVWTSLSVGSFDTDEETGAALLADPTTGLTLTGLEELGIASLSLSSSITNVTDSNGNTKSRSGTFTLADGSIQELAEYRFARNNTLTRPVDAPVLSEATRALPGLAGGAQVLTLREALEKDASAAGYLGKPSGYLRAKLDAFTSESDAGVYYARFEDLFNAWAGLEAIPAGQMRGELKARQVAALEKFFGLALDPNPHHFQALAWESSYRDLTERFYAELLNQTHFRTHYESIALVPRPGTTPYGDLMPLVPMFEAEIAADEEAGTRRLHEFARSLRGRELLGETSYFAFREHFILDPDGEVDEDKAFAFDSAGLPVRTGTTDFSEAVRALPGQGVNSAYGEDVLYGDAASTAVSGGVHNDLLYGGAGNDNLLGQEGGDIFDGGPGNDRYFGDVGRVTEGAGSDFYLFRPGSGVDRIVDERGGIDTVFFGGGLTRADVRVVAANGWGGMRFELPASGDVLHFDADWWAPSALERFAFSDGTIFTREQLFAPSEAPDVLIGTPGADTIDGLGGDDVVTGFAGDDHLAGGEGADELDGGEGADLLEGGAGNDHIVAGAGDDVIDGGAGDDRIDLGSDPISGYWLNGSGNDTFRFGFGDGQDSIFDAGGFDTVLFKPGVTPGDVSLSNDGTNLVISLAGGADRIAVIDHFREGGSATTPNFLERVQFADGTVLAAESLTNATVTGTPGADTLLGYAAAQNLILGLAGDDELFGQSRADRLEGGDGADELSGHGGNDRLAGGEGNDRLFGETEPLFISFLTESITGGNDTLEGGAGDDLLHGGGGDDVLEGGSGDDILHGGHGSDVYDGGAGDDEYIEPLQPFTYSLGADVFVFGRGDGHDTIVAGESDWSYWYWLPGRVPASEIVDDAVRLGAGIAPEDVTLFAETEIVGPTERHGNIRLQVAGDPDSSLTIRDFLGGVRGMHLWSSVRRIEFADGTVWGREDVLDRLTWQGTPDNDVIVAGQLRDRVFGEAGGDTLYGHAGDDFIDGGEGDDFIDGGAGSDLLLGGDGSDSIHTGGHGDDVIDGGAGDDRIGHWRVDRPEAFFFNRPARLEGDVTVVFGPGSGHDRVFLPNTRPDSNDVIQVTTAPADVKLVRREGDLLVTLPSTGDTLTVQHWFEGDAFRVETIRFSDGAEWDADRILAEVLIGTGEADRLTGYDSDDRIEGREGDDVLDGGPGADVYGFARGDGNDTVVAGGGDAIEFAAGIEPGDLLVRKRGGMMVMTLDSGEGIAAIDQFAGFGFNLAEVRFEDGTVWDEDMLRGRALAGTPGDDVIEGFDTGDELSGGGGEDVLDGGFGDDFYLFESGFLALSDPGGFDALSFGALMPDDVAFSLSSGELFIEVLATGDAVSIADFAHEFGPSGNIDEFLFGDESTALSAFQLWTLIGAGDAEVIFGTDFDDFLAASDRFSDRPTIIFAGEGDDFAIGGTGADEVQGEAGADFLAGNAGGDWLDGGDGDDELDGEGGEDELDGGAGDDTLFGGDGDDLLSGGGGGDWLDGGAGRDRIDGEGGDDTVFVGLGSDLDDVIAREAGGGDVTVREGFEQAYEEALGELGELADAEFYENSTWSIESDGGFASDIPLDLLEPLFEFSGGVSVDFARQALEDLQLWLTTPLRQGVEWSYEEMEEEARNAFARAWDTEDDTYVNDYWANLSWNYEIPGNIFDPLVQMGSDGLPKREAQVVLQELLGWLYQIVGSGEDSSRFYFFELYGEALVQIEEAQARLDEFSTFSNGYWIESGLVDILPGDLRDRLVALDDDVPLGEAIATLESLRDYLLQRDAGGAGEEDVIELGEGIGLEDLEIATRTDDDGGQITGLAIGIRGTNDGAIVSENGLDEGNTAPVADLSVRTLRFSSGMELSLEDVLAMADGTIGYQAGTGAAETLKGSAAEDTIEAGGGDDILLGRGNGDLLRGQFGADILGAGAGDDQAHGGPGDDILAGERGNDSLRGGPGNDVYLFNYGDGEDSIDPAFGDDGEIDTLSFGADITPDMVSALVAPDGTLTLLVDDGEGGSITMESPVHRVQFVDADGAIRIFDLPGFVAGAHGAELTGAEVPAGGGHAVAYAQTGDLFAEPFFAQNDPSDQGDQLIGSDGDDEIDGGEGDDVVAGGAGSDDLFGGEGDDVLSGGPGADFLEGGGGNDVARGGDGIDTYFFTRGDGTFTIEDSGANTLEFHGGIEFGELALSHRGGFLEIRFSSEGDFVRIAGFDPADPDDGSGVSTFYFDADGETYDLEAILERGFTIEGTDQAESLEGTAIHDTITAGDGADFIAAGRGDDLLDGGFGGDTYFFAEHDGFDELVDRESGLEQNAVEFGDDIEAGSLFAYLSAGDLYVEYGVHGDTFFTRAVNLGDPAQAIPFDAMRFADGSTLSLVDLINGGIGIEGTGGDDSLVGGSGGDRLFGLEGDDRLAGGSGGDFYYAAPGGGMDTIDDVSLPGEENTLVFLHPDMGAADLGLVYDAATGALDLLLDQETVRLAGFDPAEPFGRRAIDFVQFASGEGLTYAELLGLGIGIVGTEQADVLQGTAARDFIFALDGDDFVQTSAGSDTVYGGAGDDVYSYNRGDGVLTIVDQISTAPQNALLFGPGIAFADLRNNLRFEAPSGDTPGALVIDLGGEDRVRILGFDPSDAENGAHAVDTFVFADGAAVGYRDLVRSTFIVQGDTQDDALTGTSIGDRLYGFEGSDELRSGDGPDALTGGTGDDLLEGGGGGDEYVFNVGDGIDTIRDSAGFDDNFITFGPGITAADVSLAEEGGNLRIVYGAGDEVIVENFERSAPVIRSLRFADGTILAIGAPLNTAPFAVAALEDQAALQDSAFVYVLPADAFGDAEGDALTLSALLADGYALPAWLAFDPVAGAFSGTAANGDVGTLSIRVLAMDAYGAEAAHEFELTVLDVNDGPVVANPVADQAATEDQGFTLSLPANLFLDVDAGDVLDITVAGPAWLNYDAATRTLSGSPGNGEIGTHEVQVTASDLEGATVQDSFTITVANVNDAPVVANPVAGEAATEDAPFSFTLPADTFADVDPGAILSTFAELPAWLTYDPDTGTFSGTPANGDVGSASVAVTAVDEFGASVSASFEVTVANTNDAPLQVAPLADQFVVEDEAFSFAVSLDAFADEDLGDALTYSAEGLPAWLSFDAATGTFSGLATNDEVGAHLVEVTATDPSGATGTGLFALIVLNVNDAPVAGDDSVTVLEDVLAAVSGNVTDNDEDVDRQVAPAGLLVVSPTGDIAGAHGTLTLAADGAYLYSLDNAAAQSLREDQTVFDSFEYTLSDGIVTTTATLTVTVVGANDAPLTVADAAALGEDGVSVSGDVLANDDDVDAGTTLIVANAGSHALTWGTLQLVVDGAYTFTLNSAAQSLRAGEQAEQAFTHTVSDGLASSDDTLTITIDGANDAPVLASPIADQNAAAGTLWSFIVAANTFTDIDAGDMLSYAASLADGATLPSWLTFDAATRTFAGTSPSGAAALLIRVSATDSAQASASDVFALEVAGTGGDCVPIVGTDGDDVLDGTSGNDVIDGRGGYDRMSGGAGDDVYYVDETRGRVDLVTEGANAGYDTVYSAADYTLGANVEELHLIGDRDLDGRGNALANILVGNTGDNRLNGEDGNDLLLDDAGRDRLEGGAGDDVLDGGDGDDQLIGGAGNDLYVHTAGGDDDVVQDSGGVDAIRFGAGITAANVTVRRDDGNLVLRLSDRNGSVTVKDWFTSSSKRVEQVQFADGTVWNEATLLARLTSGGSGGGSHGGGHGHDDGADCGDSRRRGNGHDNDDGWDGHHGGRHDHKDHHNGGGGGDRGDDLRDAIAQRLKRDPNYDFTALAQYLQRNSGGGYGAMTPQQIAQRWLQVQNCVGQLAQMDDDGGGHGGGHHGGGWCGDEGQGHRGWGYHGSTGQSRGCGGMGTMAGLSEGFRRL